MGSLAVHSEACSVWVESLVVYSEAYSVWVESGGTWYIGIFCVGGIFGGTWYIVWHILCGEIFGGTYEAHSVWVESLVVHSEVYSVWGNLWWYIVRHILCGGNLWWYIVRYILCGEIFGGT